MSFWDTLTYSERVSEEKRINRLYDVLDTRLSLLEEHAIYDITIRLNLNYINPIVRFKGDIIDPNDDGDYIVHNVSPGNYPVTVSAKYHKDYENRIKVTGKSRTFLISLEPQIISLLCNVKCKENNVFGAGVRAQYINEVVTDSNGNAVLTGPAPITGVNARYYFNGRHYYSSSDEYYDVDSTVNLRLYPKN